MDIKNRQLTKSVMTSAAIVFSLGMGVVGTTVSANAAGYLQDSSGNVVRHGTGGCVSAALGRDFPECRPQIIKAQPIMKPAPVVVVKPKPPVKVAVLVPKPVVKPKPQYITKVLSLNEAGGANFGFDKDNLSDKAQMQLTTFANDVKGSNVTPSSVSVVGHTDSIGPEKYNQNLSERRANSVANYLSTEGFDRSAMQVSGRGESQPVASNKSKAGRAENRRVDIRVTGQRKITVRK